MRRLVAVVAFLALAGVGLFGTPQAGDTGVLESAAGLRPGVAAAAGSNSAGVVIDNGSSVRRVCIHFNGTLTGVEALQRAASVTVAPFGGLGVAVCAIDGVGCPGDKSCLTCQQPKFWSYSRAPAGSSGFSTSSGGASSSTVRDGDVEGWRWGGGKPAYASADEICGNAAPPPPAPSPPPVSNGGGGGGSQGASGGSGGAPASNTAGGGGSGTEGQGGRPAADGPVDVAGEEETPDEGPDSTNATSTTAASANDAGDGVGGGEPDDDAESALAVADDSTGSSGASVVGFVVLGLVLAGAAAVFLVLRMRSRS
ncbi:MAG: hypothetical protein R3A49_08595 [Acidimicrobiia bacterium]